MAKKKSSKRSIGAKSDERVVIPSHAHDVNDYLVVDGISTIASLLKSFAERIHELEKFRDDVLHGVTHPSRVKESMTLDEIRAAYGSALRQAKPIVVKSKKPKEH